MTDGIVENSVATRSGHACWMCTMYVKSEQLNKSVNTWLIFVAALFRSGQCWCRPPLRISVPFSVYLLAHFAVVFRSCIFSVVSVVTCFCFQSHAISISNVYRTNRSMVFISIKFKHKMPIQSGGMRHALRAFIEKWEEIPVARSICGNPISTCYVNGQIAMHGDYVWCAGARQATRVKNRKQFQETCIRFWACRLHFNCFRIAKEQKRGQQWTNEPDSDYPPWQIIHDWIIPIKRTSCLTIERANVICTIECRKNTYHVRCANRMFWLL